MKTGVFITFEGTDGSGKSTQIKLLFDYLIGNGYEAVMLREPGSTDIGEQIRKIILDKNNSRMDAMTEALLYAAARAQLVSQRIAPDLEAGRIVICDRFVDSSTVYQGFGRGLGEAVEIINAFAVRDLTPHITFLLKISPETGSERRVSREEDRIESENADYHNEVYQAYLRLEKRHPRRIVGIDGTGSIEEINGIIIEHVSRILKGDMNA